MATAFPALLQRHLSCSPYEATELAVLLDNAIAACRDAEIKSREEASERQRKEAQKDAKALTRVEKLLRERFMRAKDTAEDIEIVHAIQLLRKERLLLPSPRRAGRRQSAIAALLWPLLADIWERWHPSRHVPDAATGGFVKFVEDVHEAAGLGEVNGETLRKALKRRPRYREALDKLAALYLGSGKN